MRLWLLILVLVSVVISACDSEESAPPANNGHDTSSDTATDGTDVPQDETQTDSGGETDVTPDPDVEIVPECDPVGQDCEEGYLCDVRDGVPVCVADDAHIKGEDDSCIGNDCVAGLTCIVWSESEATCTSFCDKDSGEGCPEGKYCGATLRSNPDIGLCLSNPVACDIFNDTCPVGQACGFSRNPATDEPMLACVRAGEQQPGALCGGDNGRCVRGAVCIRELDGNSYCRQACQENDDCTAPELCQGLAETYEVPFCIEF